MRSGTDQELCKTCEQREITSTAAALRKFVLNIRFNPCKSTKILNAI